MIKLPSYSALAPAKCPFFIPKGNGEISLLMPLPLGFAPQVGLLVVPTNQLPGLGLALPGHR